MRTDRAVVQEPEAFLRRTVTRLCLDQLKSARHQRETYVGPWLPEPMAEDEEDEDVTLPLMLALERLSPLDRAAFLLQDVFGLDFEKVAATIAATSPPAANSPPVAAPTCALDIPAMRWRSSAGRRSPKPSSLPRAAAT
jgi:hypothetical protein